MATTRTTRAKRTGLGTVSLDRGGAKSVISQMREQASSEEIHQIALDQIAHDPDNPASRQEADPDMIASITQVGVLQPIVVVPVEAWLANRPDHAEALEATPQARYVAWLGNRRTTNSRAAGNTTIPAVIRSDVAALAQDTGKVHENSIRRGLTPSEEARSMREAMDRHGLTQVALAEHLGTSTPRVNKLVRLLLLPTQIRALVDARAVPLETALTLLREDEAVIEQVAAAAEHDTDERIDLPRMIVATKQHMAASDDVVAGSGSAPHPMASRPSQAPTPIEGASSDAAEPAKTGAGADAPSKGAESTSKAADVAPAALDTDVAGEDAPEHPSSAPESKGSQADAATVAARRREESLHLIAQRAASPGVMTEMVAAAWLSGQQWGGVHRTLARSLLHAAGFDAQADVLGTKAWRESTASLSTRKALHAGWILTLAVREISTREAGERWTEAERSYVRWMSSHGYTTTDWEQELLEEDS